MSSQTTHNKRRTNEQKINSTNSENDTHTRTHTYTQEEKNEKKQNLYASLTKFCVSVSMSMSTLISSTPCIYWCFHTEIIMAQYTHTHKEKESFFPCLHFYLFLYFMKRKKLNFASKLKIRFMLIPKMMKKWTLKFPIINQNYTEIQIKNPIYSLSLSLCILSPIFGIIFLISEPLKSPWHRVYFNW